MPPKEKKDGAGPKGPAINVTATLADSSKAGLSAKKGASAKKASDTKPSSRSKPEKTPEVSKVANPDTPATGPASGKKDKEGNITFPGRFDNLRIRLLDNEGPRNKRRLDMLPINETETIVRSSLESFLPVDWDFMRTDILVRPIVWGLYRVTEGKRTDSWLRACVNHHATFFHFRFCCMPLKDLKSQGIVDDSVTQVEVDQHKLTFIIKMLGDMQFFHAYETGWDTILTSFFVICGNPEMEIGQAIVDEIRARLPFTMEWTSSQAGPMGLTLRTGYNRAKCFKLRAESEIQADKWNSDAIFKVTPQWHDLQGPDGPRVQDEYHDRFMNEHLVAPAAANGEYPALVHPPEGPLVLTRPLPPVVMPEKFGKAPSKVNRPTGEVLPTDMAWAKVITAQYDAAELRAQGDVTTRDFRLSPDVALIDAARWDSIIWVDQTPLEQLEGWSCLAQDKQTWLPAGLDVKEDLGRPPSIFGDVRPGTRGLVRLGTLAGSLFPDGKPRKGYRLPGLLVPEHVFKEHKLEKEVERIVRDVRWACGTLGSWVHPYLYQAALDNFCALANVVIFEKKSAEYEEYAGTIFPFTFPQALGRKPIRDGEDFQALLDEAIGVGDKTMTPAENLYHQCLEEAQTCPFSPGSIMGAGSFLAAAWTRVVDNTDPRGLYLHLALANARLPEGQRLLETQEWLRARFFSFGGLEYDQAGQRNFSTLCSKYNDFANARAAVEKAAPDTVVSARSYGDQDEEDSEAEAMDTDPPVRTSPYEGDPAEPLDFEGGHSGDEDPVDDERELTIEEQFDALSPAFKADLLQRGSAEILETDHEEALYAVSQARTRATLHENTRHAERTVDRIREQLRKAHKSRKVSDVVRIAEGDSLLPRAVRKLIPAAAERAERLADQKTKTQEDEASAKDRRARERSAQILKDNQEKERQKDEAAAKAIADAAAKAKVWQEAQAASAAAAAQAAEDAEAAKVASREAQKAEARRQRGAASGGSRGADAGTKARGRTKSRTPIPDSRDPPSPVPRSGGKRDRRERSRSKSRSKTRDRSRSRDRRSRSRRRSESGNRYDAWLHTGITFHPKESKVLDACNQHTPSVARFDVSRTVVPELLTPDQLLNALVVRSRDRTEFRYTNQMLEAAQVVDRLVTSSAEMHYPIENIIKRGLETLSKEKDPSVSPLPDDPGSDDDTDMEDGELPTPTRQPLRRDPPTPPTPAAELPNSSTPLLRPKNPDKFNGKMGKDGIQGLSAQADSWIYQLEVMRRGGRSVITVMAAVSFLSDDALQWWRGVEDEHPTGTFDRDASWDLFVDLFKQRFISGQDSIIARNALVKLTQSGSVTSYISDYKTMIARIKLGEKPDKTTQATNFLAGLHGILRNKLTTSASMDDYVDIDKIMHAALAMETKLLASSAVFDQQPYYEKDDRSRKSGQKDKSNARDADKLSADAQGRSKERDPSSKRQRRGGGDRDGSDRDGTRRGGGDDSRREERRGGDDRRGGSTQGGRGFGRTSGGQGGGRGAGRGPHKVPFMPRWVHDPSAFPQPGQQDYHPGPCHFCKEAGHSINQCLKLQNRRAAENRA